MSSHIENLLAPYSQLYVQQRKEWAEILVAWETSNKYVILDPQQQQVGFVAERGGGLLNVFYRMVLRSHRPLEIDLFNRAGEVILHLSRSFFFFFSDLDVRTPGGERLGSIHRRFGIIHKKYDLRDAEGTLFARIASPLWRLWTFPVEGVMGGRAAISKRWGGALAEVFTDADTFQVDFGTGDWSLAMKAVIFAASISIDFDFFENNQGSRSVLDMVTPD